jgi:DNA-binding NarL/FixJ family response regulator
VADITVLIVDDQPIYRSALADLLEIVGGYRVAGSAATAEEAIDAVRRSPVDLVFMDLRLPGMDGLAATRQIRSIEEAPEVIIISTDVEALTSEELGTSGAFEARAKADLDPDWLDALRVRIRDLSGRPRPGRE